MISKNLHWLQFYDSGDHMWPTTAFSVTRGSIHELSSNLRFPPTHHNKC